MNKHWCPSVSPYLMYCCLFQVAGVILLGQFLHSLRMRHLGAIPEVGSVTAKQELEEQAAISVCQATGILAQRVANHVLAL